MSPACGVLVLVSWTDWFPCRYGPLEAEAKVRVARKEKQKSTTKESDRQRPVEVGHA